MITLNQVRECQKDKEKDGFFNWLIYRKISLVLTWIFVNLYISANMVTFLGLILVDGLAVYFIVTKHWILAGILVQLFIAWDNSDGEVARFNIRHRGKKPGKRYGEYLDDILGVIGFYFVILLTGFYTDLWAGILASYAMLLLNFSSGLSNGIFEKEKIAKKAQDTIKSRFGMRIKGKIGFTAEVQRTLVSLALFFSAPVFLYIYFAGAVALILAKFWVYRNY